MRVHTIVEGRQRKMTPSRPRIAALIPMKDHSARVPGKNIRPLCGKPLFHWIVATLLQVPDIDEIVIETDSARIAEDALRNFPVTILRRPDYLLGDETGINALLTYHLSQVKADIYLQTHSTNPLLTAQSISAAIAAYRAPGPHDCLFSVTPLQTRFYWPDGRAINHSLDEVIQTQNLPPVMEENSCIYLLTQESFHKRGHRIGTNPILFPINRAEAVDIDEEFDFAFAEFLMQRRLASASQPR